MNMDKNKTKKQADDLVQMASALIGNELNQNEQVVTQATADSFGLLLYKAGRLHNVGFEQGKGNLFEYIENAKLETNLAKAGILNMGKHFVTDAPGHLNGYNDPHGAADFRIAHQDGSADLAQAKYNNQIHKAAQNFVNPKYQGMERVAPVDQIPEIRSMLKSMADKGEISKAAYQDAVKNLEPDGLRDSSTGITSGGTTTHEVQNFRGANGKVSATKVKHYVEQVQRQQYVSEIQGQALKGGAAAAVVTGVISVTTNMAAVLKDEKKLGEAMKDVGITTAKAGIRGAATGGLSATIRIGAANSSIKLLTNGTAATVMAASLIDAGVSFYDYARGNIDGRQLVQNLQDTTIKGVTTVYFSNALAATLGATSVFVPIAIFTVAQYGVMSIRSIMQHAKLNAEEYRRMEALYRESMRTVHRYQEEMERQLTACSKERAPIMHELLAGIRPDASGVMDYGQAITRLVCFAEQAGFVLQHADRDEFREAMQSQDPFVLE